MFKYSCNDFSVPLALARGRGGDVCWRFYDFCPAAHIIIISGKGSTSFYQWPCLSMELFHVRKLWCFQYIISFAWNAFVLTYWIWKLRETGHKTCDNRSATWRPESLIERRRQEAGGLSVSPVYWRPDWSNWVLTYDVITLFPDAESDPGFSLLSAVVGSALSRCPWALCTHVVVTSPEKATLCGYMLSWRHIVINIQWPWWCQCRGCGDSVRER